MKKNIFLIFFFLPALSCSIFRAKVSSYPEGVFFPVEMAVKLTYEGQIIALIMQKEENLYLSTRSGYLYCVNGRDIQMRWKHKASEDLVSSPFLTSDSVLAFDSQGLLVCVGEDGAPKWKTMINGKISSGIGGDDEQIFLGTEEGEALAFETRSGTKAWSFTLGEPLSSTPISFEDKIIFACEDGSLNILTKKGVLIEKQHVGGRIKAPFILENKNLYFGTDDKFFYCWNLGRGKKKWRIKTGGSILSPPVIIKDKVFFLSWNSVLYCVNKRNGTILWWKTVPSRSYYRIELSGGKIIVTSLSSRIVCFDVNSGRIVGSFDTENEVNSNPVWLEPHLVFSHYDSQFDSGTLVFLKKAVKLVLSPSQKSPYVPFKEIIFTAKPEGFFMPQFEFYIREEGEKNVVQEKSETNTWVWFPEKIGTFTIGVVVTDEKESAEAEMSYMIKEKEIKNL
jgi:outer membrane protein assembly factor BamB